ncbi:DMT family transporter [Agromyces silvae]|uniref:DMT family transporter n=1 Tax=Agromyces silvae TaxID=3388266 RepID=UPI00280BA54E|nr:DMT family transporter [Agromyces protaetiae]
MRKPESATATGADAAANATSDSAADAAAGATSGATPGAGRTEHRHADRLHLPVWLAVAIAVLCGAGTAVQSRINGELARELGDPYTTAAISFGSGLVILLITLAVWRPGRVGFGKLRVQLRERRILWWMLFGGLAGAYFVTTQGLSAGVLGVAVFTVAIVAGQTIGGLVFDLIGLGPGGRRPVTATRLTGALLALAAIGWAVSGQLAHEVPLLLMLLPFAAGVGAAWQQAVNGRVRAAADSALTSTALNFIVGTTALVIVMFVHAGIEGFPAEFPTEPWLYLGGLMGCLFIAGQAIVVRIIGVLVLALAGVAGQLTAALALDLLAPTHGRVVDAATIGGTALALIAVGVASISRRRHRHRAASVGEGGSPGASTQPDASAQLETPARPGS